MKAFDANVELQVIKTICDSSQKIAVLGQVNAEHFGSEAALEVYTRVINLIAAGKNPPSSEVLRNDGAISPAAQAFISSNQARALENPSDIEAALGILSKYRKGRLIMKAVTDAVTKLKVDDPKIDDVVSEMETALQRCHSTSARDEMFHISAERSSELLEILHKKIESAQEDLIPTGFREFDKRTGGFRKKNVIALASVPGGGKSAMMSQMAVNQYMMGYNVAIVSYEMDRDEILDRMWSNISKVNHSDINLKRMDDRSKKHISKKFEEWIKSSGRKNRLTIMTPERELNVPEIAMELKPFGFDIIYIDYIGLLKQDPKKQMHEVLGDHARNAKLAANSLNAAMVLLAQFDDESLKIKYSKAIQANAHFVWAWENKEEDRLRNMVEIKQLKARNAGVYNFTLNRDFSTMTFSDVLPSSEAPPIEAPKKEAAALLPRMIELQ